MLRVDRADRRRASLLDLEEDRAIRQNLKLAEAVSIYSLKGFVENLLQPIAWIPF